MGTLCVICFYLFCLDPYRIISGALSFVGFEKSTQEELTDVKPLQFILKPSGLNPKQFSILHSPP